MPNVGGLMSRVMRFGLAVMLAGLIAACSATYRNHGYMPTDTDVEVLQIGVDTRETVAQAIGQPGTAGLLTSSGWYYVQSRFKHFTYNAPEEIDRQVLAILRLNVCYRWHHQIAAWVINNNAYQAECAALLAGCSAVCSVLLGHLGVLAFLAVNRLTLEYSAGLAVHVLHKGVYAMCAQLLVLVVAVEKIRCMN